MKNHEAIETIKPEMRFVDSTWTKGSYMSGIFKVKENGKYLILTTQPYGTEAQNIKTKPSVYVDATGGIPIATLDDGQQIQLTSAVVGKVTLIVR